jgi:delta 1-pyrroline-5-carboxylate dehydrogenase
MNAEKAKALTYDNFRRSAAALKPETRMFINGTLVDARSGDRFETINPANGQVLATVPTGTVEDVDLAVASARKAFKSGVWARLEPRARMKVLYRLVQLIDEHALEFALLDSLDFGKPVLEMLTGDVPAAALTFQYFGETIDKIEGVVTNTASDAFTSATESASPSKIRSIGSLEAMRRTVARTLPVCPRNFGTTALFSLVGCCLCGESYKRTEETGETPVPLRPG